MEKPAAAADEPAAVPPRLLSLTAQPLTPQTQQTKAG